VAQEAREEEEHKNCNIHPFPIRQTGIKFDYQNFIIIIIIITCTLFGNLHLHFESAAYKINGS
jgi:hypothetical protein